MPAPTEQFHVIIRADGKWWVMKKGKWVAGPFNSRGQADAWVRRNA